MKAQHFWSHPGLCVNSDMRSVRRSGFRFPAGMRSPYSFSHSDEKPEASRACLAANVLAGVRCGRIDRRTLGALRPPRILGQWRRVPVVVVGSGVLRRLDDLHRPIGINRPYAQALLSPTLRKITRLCSALVCPAMKLRRGRNARYFPRFGSFRAWLRCA